MCWRLHAAFLCDPQASAASALKDLNGRVGRGLAEVAGELLRMRNTSRCKVVLQHRSFFDQSILGKTRKAQQRGIDQISSTREDQIRENFPRCRRMHHAVAAEAIGAKESRHLRNRTKNR